MRLVGKVDYKLRHAEQLNMRITHIFRLSSLTSTLMILAGCGKSNGLLTRNDTPPADFFSAQLQGPVIAITPDNPFGSVSVARVGLTVADATKGYKDDGGTWSKLSDNQWMLSLEQIDKVMQRTNSARLVFERLPQANGDVQFKRLVMNGEEQNYTVIGDLIIAAKKGVKSVSSENKPKALEVPEWARQTARKPSTPETQQRKLIELTQDSVLDAFKRSSMGRLPVFLKLADVHFDVVNSVDALRMIKGDVVVEFVEDTFEESRALRYQTPTTVYKVQLLKMVKKKGDRISRPFEAQIDLTDTSLKLPLPPLEDYGAEKARFRHGYVEGGEIAIKAEELINASADAAKKADLLQRKWDRLQTIKKLLTDEDYFNETIQGRGPAFTLQDSDEVAFGDDDLTKRIYREVVNGKFRNLRDKYAAYKEIMNPAFEQAYPRIEKIILDAKQKDNACSEYLLNL